MEHDIFFKDVQLYIHHVGDQPLQDDCIKRSNITYSFYEHDPGLAFMLNQTIKNSTSEYLALMRQDAYYANNWYELLARSLERAAMVDLAYGGFYETYYDADNFYEYALKSCRMIRGFDPMMFVFLWSGEESSTRSLDISMKMRAMIASVSFGQTPTLPDCMPKSMKRFWRHTGPNLSRSRIIL